MAGGARTGRRPGPTRTRQTILRAARAEFARRGYEGATIRDIARAARVDAALVHHYFRTKEGVFAAAMELPVNPAELLPRVLAGPRDGLGERVVRNFLGVWDDPSSRAAATAMLRSALSHDRAAALFRGFVRDAVLAPVARALGLPDSELRATLVASHLVGLGFARYVLRLEPLASEDTERIVAAVAPSVQRYLTGELPA